MLGFLVRSLNWVYFKGWLQQRRAWLLIMTPQIPGCTCRPGSRSCPEGTVLHLHPWTLTVEGTGVHLLIRYHPPVYTMGNAKGKQLLKPETLVILWSGNPKECKRKGNHSMLYYPPTQFMHFSRPVPSNKFCWVIPLTCYFTDSIPHSLFIPKKGLWSRFWRREIKMWVPGIWILM